MSDSIYTSKGELKNWAHMDKDELATYRDQIKSEIAAGNIDPKELNYLEDFVLQDMENALQSPASNIVSTAAPVAPSAPVTPTAPPATSGGSGSSVYDSNGELKNWANMDKDELATYRDQIKSEIAAGNIDPKESKYLEDIVLQDMESALQNPTKDVVAHAAPAAPVAPVKPSSSTTATKPVSNSAQASAQSPVKVGKPTNSSTSVPSRTNQPKSATAAAATAESSPATARATTSVAPSATVTSKAGKSAEELAEEALRAGGGASTGAPLKGAMAKLREVGDNVAGAVSKGTHGSKNLRLAGAAAILGAGAIAMRRRSSQNDDYQRRLAMQRRGI